MCMHTLYIGEREGLEKGINANIMDSNNNMTLSIVSSFVYHDTDCAGKKGSGKR